MDERDELAAGSAEDTPRFGQLRPLAASSAEGWDHEAHDFTPWLAENIELLGEELGLVLRLKEREAAVGRYSLDLLLEDAQGRTVIVENQFGKTDHDHLGKLLTYCAGTEAEVAVWLSESLTDEHVAALEWLNENTVAGVGFFGVELGLLKIDDSRPAPRFRVVVKPNEWKKRARPEPQGPVEPWDWPAFGEALGISQQRIEVGRALVDRIEAALRDRGLPWKTAFRKGYVGFQRSGGYNVLIVDLYWRRAPRLAVKIPAPIDELGMPDPFPDLDSSWVEAEREWGWTVPSVSAIPDVNRAIELAHRLQPESGPLRLPDRG
ncbi:MAG TPA: hypothetical protein VFJ64_09515 [Solirubrobacterales bacterium]|nr:hypothetical protein [Solirubrobacterales bacterium]